jgi:hypothetical protein
MILCNKKPPTKRSRSKRRFQTAYPNAVKFIIQGILIRMSISIPKRTQGTKFYIIAQVPIQYSRS